MEIYFLILLFILMLSALGSGFPVAFALPGSAILTIGLAGVLGFMIYKIKKARDQSSSYFKIQGTEMLNSQI